MCRVVDTVLVDQETVYAPRQGNDRLLLGLKGSLNEYELDLENPIYGGAYAYGKSGLAPGFGSSPVRPGARRKPREDWLALIPGSHEGYVSWERAEAIRTMVSDNVPTSRHHGAPKHGDA